MTPCAQAGIDGSSHDFSGSGWTTDSQICLPCHTPHNADTNVTDAPLWNHAVTDATYTTYNSPTMYQTPENPRGPTKLCLSCHDGTVALDSFGGATGSTSISGAALIGTDLSNDHPVSVYWNHQTVGICHPCHDIDTPRFPTTIPFPDHYVECATCHDVHNNTGETHLLRITLNGSELCLTCHTDK